MENLVPIEVKEVIARDHVVVSDTHLLKVRLRIRKVLLWSAVLKWIEVNTVEQQLSDMPTFFTDGREIGRTDCAFLMRVAAAEVSLAMVQALIENLMQLWLQRSMPMI